MQISGSLSPYGGYTSSVGQAAIVPAQLAPAVSSTAAVVPTQTVQAAPATSSSEETSEKRNSKETPNAVNSEANRVSADGSRGRYIDIDA
ncbi:MAG: hypothetical protein ACOYK8_02450 [Alphaproteobacteria bacterium]